MAKKLVIIGAGGHGKVIADIAVKNGYSDIAFLDDRATGACLGFPIIGTSEMLRGQWEPNTEFVIAVGNNAVRKRIAQAHDLAWATLIHPSAQIGLEVQIGAGTVVMAGAAVNPCANIGNHCIINTGAVVEHDNVLENYVHLSPDAALGGTVHIGECTHVGIGASVKNNVSICSDAVIGAGAAVITNIDIPGTYAGVPSRLL